MRFLIIGCGSVGERHLRNLKSLGRNLYGFDCNLEKLDLIRRRYNIKCFSNLSKALAQKIDAALICTPTSTHVSIALEIAKRGINLFIEKPLSNTLEGIDRLERLILEKSLVLMVACNPRFLPSLNLARRLIEKGKIGRVISVTAECGFFLPYWHPYEDYRKGYSANKKMGGGVIFDDIHEIDTLYWLFGDVKEIFCYAKKLSNLEIDTEDFAEIFLILKSGIVAQIHLDYLQRTYHKSYKFIGEDGILTWDYIRQTVRLYGKKPNQCTVFSKDINVNHEIMFIEELNHFIRCLQGKEKPVNDIRAAKRVLQIAIAAHKSARENRVIKLE